MKKKSRKITNEDLATSIEDLARMTHNGFVAVDKRFDKVEDRLDKLDGQMSTANGRLGRIEDLLITSHERRLDKLEDNVRVIKTVIEKR